MQLKLSLRRKKRNVKAIIETLEIVFYLIRNIRIVIKTWRYIDHLCWQYEVLIINYTMYFKIKWFLIILIAKCSFATAIYTLFSMDRMILIVYVQNVIDKYENVNMCLLYHTKYWNKFQKSTLYYVSRLWLHNV